MPAERSRSRSWRDSGRRLLRLRNAFQLQAHIVGRLETVFAIFCQTGGYEIIEGRRRKGLASTDGFGIFLQNGRGYADLAFALKCALAHGHLVEDRAERKNVRARVS